MGLKHCYGVGSRVFEGARGSLMSQSSCRSVVLGVRVGW